MPARIAGLYAIADTYYLDDTRIVSAVTAALLGGARVIQYRDKSADAARRERQARALARLCRDHHAIFLINDDVVLAKTVAADGVHLGRNDTSLREARHALGAQMIIGISCYDDSTRAQEAQEQGADYIAFGSFFPSQTKPQAVRAPIALLRDTRAMLRIPVVVIGGITPENGGDLINAGADALAVIEGICGQPDPRAAAARYASLFARTGVQTPAI